MAKVLEMPKLSPTMTEGQLTVWHKKEGDAVAVDDLLAEVETDKATMEFRSFDKGTLLKLLVPAGTMVSLGQPVAILGAPGEDIAGLLQGLTTGASRASDDAKPAATAAVPAAAAAAAPSPVGSPSVASPPAAASRPVTATMQPASLAASSPPVVLMPPVPTAVGQRGGRVRASPYVRKLAREHGIELSTVTGTGPNGRIVARDLQGAPSAVIAPQAPQAPPAPVATTSVAMVPAPQPLATVSDSDEVRPLSMMRKVIARRLTESKQTVPHFYLTIDVDAGPLARLRDQINLDLAAAQSQAAQGGPESASWKVSFNDLIIKACAIALTRVPECNASFTSEAIVVHRRVDISIAVAIPDGLVTPVVRQADRKSIVGIAREIRDLAARAKAKKLRPEEMSDGTFSISNLGMFGIDSFAAVINPPEGAILAVGRVRDEPVVWEGAVVPGKRLALTLSCDHRVVDGAVGARFLAELRALVERPTQMLVF